MARESEAASPTSIEFEAISLPRALYAAVAETPRLQGVWLVGCVCGEFYEDAARATRQLVENLTAAGFEPDVLREVKGAAADSIGSMSIAVLSLLAPSTVARRS